MFSTFRVVTFSAFGVASMMFTQLPIEILPESEPTIVHAILAESIVKDKSCNDLADTKEVILCFANEYELDPDLAVRVSVCESGLKPLAKNASSTASGLFQHLASRWSDRIERFNLPPDFDIWNVHDNTVMAMELASADGWKVHWGETVDCWSR